MFTSVKKTAKVIPAEIIQSRSALDDQFLEVAVVLLVNYSSGLSSKRIPSDFSQSCFPILNTSPQGSIGQSLDARCDLLVKVDW